MPPGSEPASGENQCLCARSSLFSIIVASMIFAGPSAFAADAKRDIVTVKDADYFGFDLRTEQNLSLDQVQGGLHRRQELQGLHL